MGDQEDALRYALRANVPKLTKEEMVARERFLRGLREQGPMMQQRMAEIKRVMVDASEIMKIFNGAHFQGRTPEMILASIASDPNTVLEITEGEEEGTFELTVECSVEITRPEAEFISNLKGSMDPVKQRSHLIAEFRRSRWDGHRLDSDWWDEDL